MSNPASLARTPITPSRGTMELSIVGENSIKKEY
jgi:hypothetical protein